MKQYSAIPTVPQPFMMIFEDRATLEGVGGPICLFGAITMHLCKIEESYLYIMHLSIKLMIWNKYETIYCHTNCATAIHDDF